MAWKDSLQIAKFRDVVFDCIRIEDELAREIVRYSYPYVDGEDIEDLGQKAGETNVTAVFYGDDYETRLKTFLSALSTTGPAELIHPIFGSMQSMQFLGGHVSHSADDVDTCYVEMRFAKSTPSAGFFVSTLPVQQSEATTQLATVGQSAATGLFATAMSALAIAKAGLKSLSALRDVLNNALGPIERLVSNVETTALDYISFPSAFASDLVGLVSGMTDLRSFDVGTIMSDWSGMVDQMSSVVKLPSDAAAGVTTTLPGDSTASTVAQASTTTDLSAPYAPGLSQTVTADASDVAVVTAVVTAVAAMQTASVASDVLANETSTPTLTPTQVEQIADDTRTLIQSAIDTATAAYDPVAARPVVEALKDAALSVQTLSLAVINTLPPLITRTVDTSTNLTLLAFKWYGDYTRSAELLRLNPTLRNPNFLNRGDVLNAFAE